MNEPIVSVDRIAAAAVDAVCRGLPVEVCPWPKGTQARILFEADYEAAKQKLDAREMVEV